MKATLRVGVLAALCALAPARGAEPRRDLDHPERTGDYYMLRSLREGISGAYTRWEAVARIAAEEPRRFAEIVLPSQGLSDAARALPPEYRDWIAAEAVRNDAAARGEARLWREGWLRVASQVLPLLEKKAAPGERRIALEFLKAESGGDDLGFRWVEEPDSAANRVAIARWRAFFEAPAWAVCGRLAYVTADVLNVRMTPAPDAPVTDRLRMRTVVTRGRSEGDRVEIVTFCGPVPVRGWVDRRYLSKDPPAREAVEGAEAAGGAKLPGAPVYLAACAEAGVNVERQVILLAKLTAKGAVPVRAEEDARVGAETWFVLHRRTSEDQEKSWPVEGTPFPRTRSIGYMYGEGRLVSLGRGCEPGDLYATAPLHSVERLNVPPARFGAAAEEARRRSIDEGHRGESVLDSVTIERLGEGAPVESVRVDGRARFAFVYSEPAFHPVSLWSFAGPDGSVRYSAGGVGAGQSTRVEEVRWTGTAEEPRRRIGLVRTENEAGTTGAGEILVIVAEPDGDSSIVEVKLWDGGCLRVSLTPPCIRGNLRLPPLADRCPSGLRSTVGSRV